MQPPATNAAFPPAFARRGLLALLVAAATAAPAAAEPWRPFFSGLAGVSGVEDTDITVASPGQEIHLENPRSESSLVLGGRAGVVHGVSEGLELGVTAEVSTYSPDVPAQSVRARGTANGVPFDQEMAIGETEARTTDGILGLLLRFPLEPGPEHPHGRFAPYLGVGLGFSHVHVELLEDEDGDTSWLLQIAGGAELALEDLSIFAEYRFQRANHELEILGGRAALTARAHQLVAGVTFGH